MTDAARKDPDCTDPCRLFIQRDFRIVARKQIRYLEAPAEQRCPVCGKYYFSERGSYEICPVCGWEDDPSQKRYPDMEGGANRESLNEARRKYEAEHGTEKEI